MTATQRLAVRTARDQEVRSRTKGRRQGKGTSAPTGSWLEPLHRLRRQEELSIFHALNVEFGGNVN